MTEWSGSTTACPPWHDARPTSGMACTRMSCGQAYGLGTTLCAAALASALGRPNGCNALRAACCMR
eukprot:9287299-Alexandrium_andersonii.AAC.1